MVFQVQKAAARQVVDDVNPEAFRNEKIHHVTANESGAACYDGDRLGFAHCGPSFFIVFTFT